MGKWFYEGLIFVTGIAVIISATSLLVTGLGVVVTALTVIYFIRDVLLQREG